MNNPRLRYIVTKCSDDGTFQVGDHIRYMEDSSVMCAEALGWIDPENVANATKGMEVEVDAEWVKARSAKLRKEMDDLVESGSRK